MTPRKLSLKREELRELTTDELAGIVGGTRETWFSCLDFVSCNPIDCLSVERARCGE